MSFFLIPITGAGTKLDPRRPKYVRGLCQWAAFDFAETAILWTDGTQDAAISANLDVVTIPPLDNLVTAGNRATVIAQIESLDIPAQWVQVGMTFRTVVRVCIGEGMCIQRMNGMGLKPVIKGHLDDQINTFPANMVQGLADAADSLGLDRSRITGTTLLRDALFDVGQQFASGRIVRLGDL